MSVSRRGFLASAGLAAGAAVAGGVVAGCDDASTTPDLPDVSLPAAVAGLPVRQHAWEATLARDQYGNAMAPKFDRLLFFDVNGRPTPRHVRILEAGLRRLEHQYRWGPDGLLFTASWGHSYFTKLLDTAAPIPAAKALSTFESPSFDDYHLCLHLACDNERRLAEVETELLRGAHRITTALHWRETRTGFTGTGLPAARQNVMGIPAGDPVPKTAPLFMGFKSGLKGNQATEDAVTIPTGPFTEGTTMTVSYMTLSLDSWYQNLTEAERVGLMYSPQTTVADQKKITTDAKSNPDQINQAINHYGVVGHSQSSARARRNGKAIILRRDFDTTDGGQAGLHFVSLQRDIQDFITTQTQMNVNGAQLQNPSVTETSNNGINAFLFVLKRANYSVPSRPDRSFPLLPGRHTELRQSS
jgi:dye decolorizing peroxidase